MAQKTKLVVAWAICDNLKCVKPHRWAGDEKTPLSLCGKCKRCYYCSAECQIANWKDGHKESCSIYAPCMYSQCIKATLKSPSPTRYTILEDNCSGRTQKTLDSLDLPLCYIPTTIAESIKQETSKLTKWSVYQVRGCWWVLDA